MEINKIGSAIKYFREMNRISQSQLCKGLCSVATLSRVEAGEREIDSFLLATLLERLGKSSNQFEMILTENDYMLYNYRDRIKRFLEDKKPKEARYLLDIYEKTADSKITVHKQFIAASKAALNDIQDGKTEMTMRFYIDAISYTIPDFGKNDLGNNYYGVTEFSILIEIIQRMMDTEEKNRAKDLLLQLLKYFERLDDQNNELYPKVIIMVCRLYIEEGNYSRALELCGKGIEFNKSSRKLDYRGELLFMKAQLIERLSRKKMNWEQNKKECIQLYLQAYYVFEFCNDNINADHVLECLQEEYQWGCTVWGT